MKDDLQQVLEQLHTEVGLQLLERIRSGNAKASDFGQAIKFLSDNGIDIESLKKGTMDELGSAVLGQLPFSNPADVTQC